MKEKSVGITISIPENLNEKLKIIAQQDSRSVTNLLRLVIQEYVNKKESI